MTCRIVYSILHLMTTFLNALHLSDEPYNLVPQSVIGCCLQLAWVYV